MKKLTLFLIFIFVYSFCIYASGSNEIKDFTINYKDGNSGIKCINIHTLTAEQIRSELTVIAFSEDGEEQIDLTDDISISKSANGWIASYEYKTGVWVFGSNKTITEPILINPLKSLTVVYPDSNSASLMINHSKLTSSDVKRLKFQATFSSGEKEDVTNSCTISITGAESIEVTYKLNGQNYKHSFDLNLDKLVNLKVIRKGPTGSVLSNYPLPSNEEVKSNVIVQALYSSGIKTDVTDNCSYKIQGNNIYFYYGEQSAEIPLDILTKISASTLSGKKIKVIDYSSPNEAAIRDKLQVTAYYSNGFQKDVTEGIEISVSNSNVLIKYGDLTVVGDFLLDVGTQSWMVVLLLITSSVILITCAIMYYKKTILRENKFLKRLSEIESMRSL